MRILYVHSTLVPPPTDIQTDRFYLLSETLEGDILQPVWFSKPAEVEAIFGPGSYPVYTVGRFRYHWFLAFQHKGLKQRLAGFAFYLRKGVEIFHQQKYDCIVAYSHMTTGLMAGLIKLRTGAKLIIEIVTAPEWAYLVQRPKPTLGDRIMHLYSNTSLYATVLLADRAHYLFPNQLAAYAGLRGRRNSVFHDFIPTAIIGKHQTNPEVYILLSGMPWYPKGADLLVRAFLRLAPDFPQVKLQLLSFFGGADQPQLLELIGGSPQIELLQARPHVEALRVIRESAIVVLPSRYEGLPRVLIEAMVAGLPVVASDVGGIPALIHDGENGFVVPRGDTQLLEKRLRQLLADPELRQRMGDNGYQRAHAELTEKVYVSAFTRMIEDTVGKDGGKDA